jgi:WD40 repeat protein
VAWRDWQPSITHRVLLGYGGSVAAVALGSAHGRAVVVTGGSGGIAVVWDLEIGAVLHPLAQTAEPTWLSLRITALAAGEGVAVVGDNGGRAELWDLETGRSIRVITEEYSEVEGVALSGDGSTVVTTGWVDGSAVVRVWDAATGAALRTLTGHDGAVTEVALVASGGRTVVIGGGGQTNVGALHAWDLETGRHLQRFGKVPGSQQEHGWLRTLSAVQVDGRALVLTAEAVGTFGAGLVRTWDVESGRLLRGFPSEPMPSLWSMAAGWSGGRLLAVTAGDIDGAVQLWDALTGQFLGDLAGHTQKVEATAVGELNGRSVAVTGDEAITGGSEATVRVWDLDGDPGRHGPQPEVSRVRTGTVAGRAVLVTAEASTIAVRDGDTGKIVRELRGHPTRVRAISLCEVDGRATAVSTGSYGDGLAHVWDLETGRLLRRLDGGDTSLGPLVTGVLGDQVVAATANGALDGERSGEVHVWDVATGARLHLLACGTYGADALALGMAGGRQILVTGSGSDATVRVWDLKTGQLTRTLAGNSNYIRTVAVTELAGLPVLVTGGGDVCLWDLTDGKKISSFGDHRTLMTCVNLGEFEGRPIAVTVSVGDDRRIALWSMPDGAFLGAYEGPAGWVGFADLVTLRGRPTIVAPDEDGSVHLWELTTGVVTRLPFGSKVHDVVAAGDDLIVAANAGLTRLSWFPATAINPTTPLLSDGGHRDRAGTAPATPPAHPV